MIRKGVEKKHIIAIAPGDISIPRGTPLRIWKILEHLSNDNTFIISVFTQTDIHYLATKKIEPKSKFLNNIVTLIRYYRAHKGAVFLCHTLETAKYILPIKLLTRAKVVLDMHGFTADEARLEGNIGWFRYIVNSLFHRIIFSICDLITTCSYTATKIISSYNRNVITVIPSADTMMFSPAVQPGYTFKTRSTEFILGYAGNARPWQGLDFLLECLTELNKENSHRYRLALLLSGEYKSDLQNRKDVIILPKVPYSEVPSFLASCDCLVIPRPDSYVNRVSFPSKLIEYLAMGKPIVASKTSDMHKIIQHGIDGLLFEPGDKNGFIQAVKQLNDPKLKDLLSQNARNSVKKYTWDTQNQIFLEKLKKL